ncbi:helix-turn-helix domain-containing protein [Streptomyces sp. NRRL WC-3742]|uniref:helix-turn-helix domain-containing protein n=1 Tax=Streptomyces sp. NRRL WC-3742 TaxID=1463934 RepID=UPI00068B3304|nr:helix-turn-helix transcriptional regulator [Streptomyces sp. NRRL WC-3742]
MGVEADGFAAMLSELKERSGRSYGVLASRLHVSTSTLHRYCNGAAVPAEYAPVERFARVCGAEPAELVELHRRWILADAARRREPGGAGGGQGAKAAEASVAESSAAAVVPAAAATVAPAAVPAADPAAVPAVEEPGPVNEPVAGAGGRSRWSRSRVLVGAAALVVLAAAVPAYLMHSDGQRSADAAGQAGTTTPPTAAAPASAPASAPAAVAAPASASAAPPPQAPPAPFHVSVLATDWQNPCEQWFLSPRPPGKVTPPPTMFAANDSWAAAQEAVPAGHLHLQLTALGDSSQVVVLNTISIEVVSTQPAFKGYAYTPGSGCGGGLEPSSFDVDLDSSPPRIVAVPETGKKTALNFPFKVSNTDPQVINIDATTKSQDVSWNIVLTYTAENGLQGRMTVNDHDKAFRTVGMKGAPAYFLNERTWTKTSNDVP